MHLKPIIFILCVSAICLHTCLCAMCVPCWYSQKRMADPLELDLQNVVSSYVGAGIEPQFSGKAAEALNH